MDDEELSQREKIRYWLLVRREMGGWKMRTEGREGREREKNEQADR